jgi:hypothetical protein
MAKTINFTDEVKEFNAEAVSKRFKDWKCSAYCGWGCGPGWQPILYKLCTDIEHTLDFYKIPKDQFVVAQVKEKFGTLRFYWEFREGTRDDRKELASSQIHDLVRSAEDKTAKTCEFCGQPGKLRSGGWVKCTCDSCEDQDVHWTDVDEILELAT